MVMLVEYPGLTNSLKLLKAQVLQSINYIREVLPEHVKTPEQIFNWCKIRTTYVEDGENELFQTAKTLFENNKHGIPGAGDCDCFTILLLACLIVRKYTNFGIVLVGRNPKQAVHIYVYCVIDGNKQYLDLTNKSFNFERYYPFKQELSFKVTPIKIIQTK